MAEILLYGDVGYDIVARDVIDQLAAANGEPVTVRLNSGGGDAYEGIAVMNALRGYAGSVTVIIESLAASAASLIAAGSGGRIVARPYAEVMIHNSWTMQMGNSADMTKAIADLERTDLKQAAIFAERAGGTVEEWLERINAETWFTAQEALDAGLIDVIEDAKAAAPAASLGRSRVMASFKYSSRSAAPPPTLGSRSESAPHNSPTPSFGQEGDAMSIFAKLAQELGTSEKVAKNAFNKILAETVAVTGEVDVTYPAETPIAPTEKVTIEPIIGDAADTTTEGTTAPQASINAATGEGLGLTFELGDVPDNFEATVDEATGVLTVKALAGVEVGDTAEVTVKVNGTTDVTATLTVRSLSDDGEADAPAEETETETVPATQANIGDTVTLPRAVYDELIAARIAQSETLKAKAIKDREAEVDKWIHEGRFSPAHRGKALAAMEKDPDAARAVWGALPVNSINVRETGHAGITADKLTNVHEKAAARRAARKNNNKKGA